MPSVAAAFSCLLPREGSMACVLRYEAAQSESAHPSREEEKNAPAPSSKKRPANFFVALRVQIKSSTRLQCARIRMF